MSDVPAGRYTVSETANGVTTTSVYTVTTTVDGVTGDTASKPLAASGSISFAFVNTYRDTTPTTGTIEITKTLTGDVPATLGAITFTVEGPAGFNGGTTLTLDYAWRIYSYRDCEWCKYN